MSQKFLASRPEAEIQSHDFFRRSKVNEIHEVVVVLVRRPEGMDGTEPGADTTHSTSNSQPNGNSPDGRNALDLALEFYNSMALNKLSVEQISLYSSTPTEIYLNFEELSQFQSKLERRLGTRLLPSLDLLLSFFKR